MQIKDLMFDDILEFDSKIDLSDGTYIYGMYGTNVMFIDKYDESELIGFYNLDPDLQDKILDILSTESFSKLPKV